MAPELVAPEPRWDIGASVLEMREQSTVFASQALVDAVPSTTWEQLGLTLGRAPGEPDWTVRSSDRAGVLRLYVSGQRTHVRIVPKLAGLDLFFLADWAFGSSSTAKALLEGRAELDAVRTDPAACLLGWYLAEVVAFATRWVRRGYVVREEDLVGRVRGRIDVNRYVTHSLAAARPHVVPCRFAEPSHDTQANRYLKTGLRRAATLARAVPNPDARRFLQELARRGLALLAGVDDVELTPLHGRRLNLNGPLRHYRPVVGFTTALLEGTYVSTDVGSHAQEAIAWPLNSLYEQTLRNVLRAWPGAATQNPSLRATLHTLSGTRLGSTKVAPDFVLQHPAGHLLVLDAKYKETRPTAGAPAQPDEAVVDLAPSRGQRVRIRRSDIYQVVAYGRHTGLDAASVALIYPVVLAADETYPEPVRVEEFNPEVRAVFFDVGPAASRHVTDLYDALAQIPSPKNLVPA